MIRPFHKANLAAAALACAFLGGCATGPMANARDPAEPFNRAMFSLNEGVDAALLKPVATAYKAATPEPAQRGVSNFFRNIGDLWSSANHAMQLNGTDAAQSFSRLLINSTIGIAGLFDVASDLGLERKPQDFGQTLGHWGVGAGPYLVLPFFGPSTLRDAAALPLDFKADPVARIAHIPTRNSSEALRLVDDRASLLRASELLDGAALDKYVFVRDAHLTRRENSIHPEADEDTAAKDASDSKAP